MLVQHSSETRYFSALNTLKSTDVTRLGGAGSQRVTALLMPASSAATHVFISAKKQFPF